MYLYNRYAFAGSLVTFSMQADQRAGMENPALLQKFIAKRQFDFGHG